MKARSLDKTSWTLSAIALGLLIYTGLRAAMLSMTHDESSTYLNGIEQPIWECFFSAKCWGTANMHILNTWLMQISVGLFGAKEFFVRLPNVLAHVIYLIYSIMLFRRLANTFWIALTGFLLLNANPYLLDFFSLGRGYGLAMAFTVMSLYYLWRWFDQQQNKAIIWCLIAAALAVISNFTFLNYLAVLIGFFLLAAIAKWIHLDTYLPFFAQQGELLGRRYQPLITISITVAVLAILLYVPITALRQLGEFEYGAETIKHTLRHLAQDGLKSQGYLSGWTAEVFMAAGLGGTSLAVLLGLFGMTKSAKNGFDRFFVATSIMWLALVLGLMVQYHLLGTKYLLHRTALIFIPLSCIPFFCLLNDEYKRLPRIVMGICIVISGFMVYHFLRTANLEECREWHYDSQTRQMIEYVSEKAKPGEKINLGVHWFYSHSSVFYIQTRELDFFEPIIYEKDLRQDTFYDYYYVMPDYKDQLDNDYVEEKDFGSGILFRRN